MSSYTQSRKCTEYVFSNARVLTLLEDVKNWFEGNPASAQKLEALLETITIEYNNESNTYVASVFVADVDI